MKAERNVLSATQECSSNNGSYFYAFIFYKETYEVIVSDRHEGLCY